MARLEAAEITTDSEKPGLVMTGNSDVKDEHKSTLFQRKM